MLLCSDASRVSQELSKVFESSCDCTRSSLIPPCMVFAPLLQHSPPGDHLQHNRDQRVGAAPRPQHRGSRGAAGGGAAARLGAAGAACTAGTTAGGCRFAGCLRGVLPAVVKTEDLAGLAAVLVCCVGRQARAPQALPRVPARLSYLLASVPLFFPCPDVCLSLRTNPTPPFFSPNATYALAPCPLCIILAPILRGAALNSFAAVTPHGSQFSRTHRWHTPPLCRFDLIQSFLQLPLAMVRFPCWPPLPPIVAPSAWIALLHSSTCVSMAPVWLWRGVDLEWSHWLPGLPGLPGNLTTTLLCCHTSVNGSNA